MGKADAQRPFRAKPRNPLPIAEAFLNNNQSPMGKVKPETTATTEAATQCINPLWER